MKHILSLYLLTVSALIAAPAAVAPDGAGMSNPDFVNAVLNGTGVSRAELMYLDGVTSDVQTQLNSKASTESVTAKMDATNAALNTAIAENPAATRAAAKAQSTSVGFLERFGRHADSTTIDNGAVPEVGPAMTIIRQAGPPPAPTIVNKALEAGTGDLIYVGGTIASPGSRFSLLVVAELRLNGAYTTGVTAPDLTFGVNSKAFSNLGAFLNTPQCLHAQVRTTGQIGASFYSESPTVIGDDGSGAFPSPPVGVKFPIRMVVDGEECRISMLGRTRVFRDERYPRCVDAEETGFFVEWGAPDTSTKYYWAIHTICANSPQLEEAVSYDTGEYSQALSLLASRDLANIQGPLRVNTSTAYNTNQGPSGSDAFATPGTVMVGYAPYFYPSPTMQAKIQGVVARATAQLSSSASASDASLLAFHRLELYAAASGSVLNVAGANIRYTLRGRFANNGNTKRIKIVRDAGGATRFDTGDLTSTGEWTMEFLEFRNASTYRFYTIFDYAGGRIMKYDESATGADNRLRVTGTSAGDVVVDYYEGIVSQ